MTTELTPTTPMEPLRDHPAKFSPEILTCIRGLLDDHYYKDGPYTLRDGAAVQILDPFGGVGRIHELSESPGYPDHTTPYYDTFAVELEPEWAAESALHGLTWQGDWLLWDAGTGRGQTPFVYHDGPDTWSSWLTEPHAVVTSCCYGNRMADHHNARDDSKRLTYRHKLGRELTEGSAAGMQWGKDYQHFHELAWRKVHRVLSIGGLFILNVKNHVRKGKIMHVAEWHRDVICKRGFRLLKDVHVPVKGMRMGENHELRVGYEHVYVFRKLPPMTSDKAT